MLLFGVSEYTAHAAKLHAGTHGAARPVPPAVQAFRIKPEAVEFLNDFVNRPELTQTLATNKGSDSWVCELAMRPEQMMRLYGREVPEHLRIGRSKVLEYLSQSCFRLQRAKSCLCGPCEEHGWQNFTDLKEVVAQLGLGAESVRGFETRINALSEYLRTQYRRSCSNILSAGCQGRAAFCIPYALSGDSEFACYCSFNGEHDMDD
eukprot:1755260-Prymnesium_polylepis.2